jgi:hypothetical protein
MLSSALNALRLTGIDPTPGFSVSNVIKTQAGNIQNKINDPYYDLIPFGPGANANSNPVLGMNTTTGNVSGGTQQTRQSGAYEQGGGGGGGGGTSAAEAQARAQALFAIENGLTSANDAMGRLDSQYRTGIGNIGRDYQDAYNRLTGQQQIGQRNYEQGRVGQLNEYQSLKSNNNTNARGWLDSARRTLGTQGAGGGSAARYGVPFEAMQMAEGANAGAQAINNRNISSLDQSWQDAEDQFKNSQNDLTRQREQGTRDYRSQIEQQRAELLNTIATLTGQRTIANGGDYQSALAASQPYTSRIQGILSKIDGLAATPRIREQQVTIAKPDLAQYNWSRPQQPTMPVQDPTLGGGIQPIASEDERANPILGLFGLQDQYA